MLLSEVRDKLVTASNSLEDIIVRAVYAEEELLQELITSQMRDGKKGNGSNIVPKYTPRYADFKRKLGSDSVPYPDLLVTGSYHGSIGIDRNEGVVFFIGSDGTPQEDLASWLEKRYTSNILELTNQNFEIFKQAVFIRVTNELYGIIN